jgi:hypothetical protein
VAGSVLSALAVLAVVHVVVPDVIVARVNIARAAQAPHDSTARLDVAYLASLSGEAVEMATAATLAPYADLPSATASAEDEAHCLAAVRLLNRWGPTSSPVRRAAEQGAWRTWNAGEARGVRVVGANVGPLIRLRHAACPRGPRPASH